MNPKTLIIILGPTGAGKTDLSLEVAKDLHTEIISCDSRQFYKEMKIGTAAPTPEQLNEVKHHLVGQLSIKDYYSCGKFEIEALHLLDQLFKSKDEVVMVGGSMLYIDAITKGIDDVPNVEPQLRDALWEQYAREGLEPISKELAQLDPEYYDTIDKKNYKRIIHALEICKQSGKTYTEIRKKQNKERPFHLLKIGVTLPREELYERINRRVDLMIENGLEEEARNLYSQKDLNALNTVGYKEIFKIFEGEWTREHAIDMIKQDSRHYAKKQMTWFKKDEEIKWFAPYEKEAVVKYIKEKLGKEN